MTSIATIPTSIATPTNAIATRAEAEARVLRIRAHFENFKLEVVEAHASRDWVALGAPNWKTYCREYLGVVIGPDDRGDMVVYLRDHGLSLRAIAPLVGISKDSVARELGSGVSDETPGTDAPVSALARLGAVADAFMAGDTAAAGEIIRTSPAPAKIVGVDGKTYPSTSGPKHKVVPDLVLTSASKTTIEYRVTWKVTKGGRSTKKVVSSKRLLEQLLDDIASRQVPGAGLQIAQREVTAWQPVLEGEL